GRRHRRGDAPREDGGRRLREAVPRDARAGRAPRRPRPGAGEAVRLRDGGGLIAMSDETYRPRRSVLYMPGANERALEKAKTIPADALILDLEDAVAPDAKPEARDRVCAAVHSGEYGAKELTIRANGIGTPWHDDDLRAIAQAGPDAVVVPKVSSAAEVHQIEAALDAAGAPDRTKIWAMLETPVAMLHAEEICAASERLTVLVMGTNDLIKELHGVRVPSRQPLLPSLGLSLLAARATGKVIL